MRILAIEKEVSGVPEEAFKSHLSAEAARVWELYQANLLREICFRQDRREAVLLLECANADEAG